MTNSDPSYLTTMYEEVCNSYHALDTARMQRLGILPIASIIGLLAAGKSAADADTKLLLDVVGYIGVFSALFTIALFGYEIRGMLMCNDLYVAGAALEEEMQFRGQFNRCDESRHKSCYGSGLKRTVARSINIRNTTCAVYSLIFASWLFVALKFAFGMKELEHCAWWAGGAGIAFTIVTSLLLRYLTPPPPGPPPPNVTAVPAATS